MTRKHKKTPPPVSVEVAGKKISVPSGTPLTEIASRALTQKQREPLVALLEGEMVDLHTAVERDSHVHFFDFIHPEGQRTYTRSLFFLLSYAVSKIFPDCRLKVYYSISNGIYCEVEGKDGVTSNEATKLKEAMQHIIQENLSFRREITNWEKAISIFSRQGREDLVRLFRYWRTPAVSLYALDNYYDYFYGPLVPSTGCVKTFGLAMVPPGFIVQVPRVTEPDTLPPFTFRPKLYEAFKEAFQWASILEIKNVGDLNQAIAHLKGQEIVEVAEAFHEKKIAQIADQISQKRGAVRMAMIAGPSSSGKTTFARRLLTQLRANGWKPVTISLDDYFRERKDLGEENYKEFEKPEAVDLELFEEQMHALVEGKEVELPHFNFVNGKREFRGKKVRLSREGIVVIEGLHALNPMMSKEISREHKFNIYVSSVTQISIDDHNRISTTDSRLIRRMVRDSQFRGRDAEEVFHMWPHVREGEEKYIFPFQEEADVFFNSALIFELSILRQYAEPLLRGITPENPAYLESYRLYAFLSHFMPLNPASVPSNSILREFIGRAF